METLQINKANALAAYHQADENQKKLLVNLFGENNLVVKITDRVKTFEDACAVMGFDPDDVMPDVAVNIYPLHAVSQLMVICEALNEGWKPNWQDSNQYKYYPYFRDTGSGLSYHDDDYWTTITHAGSRLCFRTKELADYAGKQFEPIYKAFFNI